MRSLLNLLLKRSSRKLSSGSSALIWVITLIGLVLAVAANSVLGSTNPELPVRELGVEHALGRHPAVKADAPPGLQAELEQIATRVPGRNAVLVRSVDDGWVAGFRGATTFSQGTLRRIWLGAVLLDAVDQGELSLDQRVPLLSSGSRGAALHEEVGSLLRKAVAQDDRSAQDEILAGLMGPPAIEAWLKRREFSEIAFGPSNDDLAQFPQSEQGQGWLPDGTTPDGMAFGLSELFAGKVLKEETMGLLSHLFEQDNTAARRSGWQVARLKGVSPLTGPVTSAGAVAFVRARTGQRYAVVAFTSGTRNPRSLCDTLLADTIWALKQY